MTNELGLEDEEKKAMIDQINQIKNSTVPETLEQEEGQEEEVEEEVSEEEGAPESEEEPAEEPFSPEDNNSYAPF